MIKCDVDSFSYVCSSILTRQKLINILSSVNIDAEIQDDWFCSSSMLNKNNYWLCHSFDNIGYIVSHNPYVSSCAETSKQCWGIWKMMYGYFQVNYRKLISWILNDLEIIFSLFFGCLVSEEKYNSHWRSRLYFHQWRLREEKTYKNSVDLK